MKKTVIKTKGLTSYLAVTAGVGCAVSVANGAVTFYGVNAANDTNSDPDGISFRFRSTGLSVVNNFDVTSSFFKIDGDGDYITQGTDLGGSGNGLYGVYARYGSFVNGAQAGDQNYMNISFGQDSTFEAVAQFYFDAADGGYLVAIATLNDVPNPQDLSSVGGAALSISAGKAMIDGAAVPEPSGLALLALGSAGLAARRRRKMAA